MQKVTIPGMAVRFPGSCPHCDQPSDPKSTLHLSHQVARRRTSIGVPFAAECRDRQKKLSRRRNAVVWISGLVIYFGGAALMQLYAPDALVGWLFTGFVVLLIALLIWVAVVDWLPAARDSDEYALLNAIAMTGSLGGMTFTIYNDRYAGLLHALNPNSTLTPVSKKPGLMANEIFRRWWRVLYLGLAFVMSLFTVLVGGVFIRALIGMLPTGVITFSLHLGNYVIPSILTGAVARDLRLHGHARGWLALLATVARLVLLAYWLLNSLATGLPSELNQVMRYAIWATHALTGLAAMWEGVLVLRADSVTTSMPDYIMPS